MIPGEWLYSLNLIDGPSHCVSCFRFALSFYQVCTVYQFSCIRIHNRTPGGRTKLLGRYLCTQKHQKSHCNLNILDTNRSSLDLPVMIPLRIIWTFFRWSSPWVDSWWRLSGLLGSPYSVQASVSPIQELVMTPNKSFHPLCYPSLRLLCLIYKTQHRWPCLGRFLAAQSEMQFHQMNFRLE